VAITSPTSGGRSVGIVRSRNQTMDFLNEFIGNRTQDLPTYSIVSQPTTLPRAPILNTSMIKEIKQNVVILCEWSLCCAVQGNAAPCSLTDGIQRFGATFCLHLQGRKQSGQHGSKDESQQLHQTARHACA
jgi:hypothetical protein